MLHRRDLYRLGSQALGAVMGLVLAVPGAAFFLDPLRKRSASASGAGRGYELTRLSQLPVGVPQSFAIVDERRDAWVKYPREPIGSVWLVRRPDGKVDAYTAECPHLGCAITLAADAKAFKCPCHDAAFALDGRPANKVPPRGMDPLTVELTEEADPRVVVLYQRFRAQVKERIPLV